MTSTIIVKSDSKLKAQAQKTAAELGLSLSVVINNYLKKFVEEKSFFVSSGKKYNMPKSPYGVFKNSKITDKDIDEVAYSWDKTINELA